jgi:hypothetical protein
MYYYVRRTTLSSEFYKLPKTHVVFQDTHANTEDIVRLFDTWCTSLPSVRDSFVRVVRSHALSNPRLFEDCSDAYFLDEQGNILLQITFNVRTTLAIVFRTIDDVKICGYYGCEHDQKIANNWITGVFLTLAFIAMYSYCYSSSPTSG